MALTRCPWVPADDPLYVAYHDVEWGVPVHDDRKRYEIMVLESFQAGLSWRTVLHKRENFRKAFDGFDVEKVARYGERKVAALLGDAGIVRNRTKITATIGNARAFINVCDEFGSFDRYIWGFVDGKPVKNERRTLAEIPVSTPLSDRISKDLKTRGFAFAGTVIVYSHLQATGIVNDHLVSCFRYNQV